MALVDSFVKQEFDPSFELEEERKAALLEAMGLEDRDVKKLQDTMLSHEEAVAAKKEELLNIRHHRGLKTDWDEFVDRKRRMGYVLHHSEFIRRLRSVIPNLMAYPGLQPKKIGLYTVRNTPREEILDYRGNWKYVACPLYLGWIDEGIMPEYEVDLVNEVGVAVGQWRGYRTILLRLICRRWRCLDCQHGEKPKRLPCGSNVSYCGFPTSVITERDAERAFGPPTNGATASWYRRTLHEFRNGLR